MNVENAVNWHSTFCNYLTNTQISKITKFNNEIINKSISFKLQMSYKQTL